MGFEKAWKRLLHALEHAIASKDFKESCPSPTMYLRSKLVLVSLGLTGYPLGIKI